MPVAYDKIVQDIRENKFAPCYFLQGDEPFFIDTISTYIEKHALTDEQKGFNQIILYGRDVKLSDVLAQARRFPMMSERQVVIVKEAQEIADWRNKEAVTMLEDYLENVVPTTILVFCHKYKTLDGRSALAKKIDKKAVLMTANKLYDNQVPGWVAQYLKAKGFSCDANIPMLIASYIGNDLERIAREIDKMLINFPEPAEITGEHVQKYIGISKEYNAFELQNAIAQKNAPKAFEIVKYFSANPKNQPVLPLVSILYLFFSKLLILHGAKDNNDNVLSAKLKVNPYFLKDYKLAATNYPLAKTIRIISYLKNADLNLKGIYGNQREGEVLKELVYNLLNS